MPSHNRTAMFASVVVQFEIARNKDHRGALPVG